MLPVACCSGGDVTLTACRSLTSHQNALHLAPGELSEAPDTEKNSHDAHRYGYQLVFTHTPSLTWCVATKH